MNYNIEWPMKPGVITPAYLEEVAKFVEKVEFSSVLVCDGLVCASSVRPFECWLIKIRNSEDENGQVLTFLHELIHVAFYVCGFYDTGDQIENFGG